MGKRKKKIIQYIVFVAIAFFLFSLVINKFNQNEIKREINNLKSPAGEKWGNAVSRLSSIGKPAVKPLINALNYREKDIKPGAVEFLDNNLPGDKLKKLNIQLREESENFKAGACRVLGNIGDERAVNPLVKLLRNKNHRVASEAAIALGKIGEPSVDAIFPLLKSKDKDTRCNAARALGYTGSEKAVVPLMTMMGDEEIEFRNTARKAIIDLGAPAVDELVRIFREKDAEIRTRAKIGRDVTERTLNDHVKSFEEFKDLQNAGNLLMKIRDPRALDKYIELLNDENQMLQEIAIHTLGEMGDKRASKPLMELLDKEVERYKASYDKCVLIGKSREFYHYDFLFLCKVITSLVKLRENRCEDNLIELLKMGMSDQAMILTIKALSGLGSEKSIGILVDQLNHYRQDVRKEAISVLKNISYPDSMDMLTKELIAKDILYTDEFEDFKGVIDDKLMMDIVLKKRNYSPQHPSGIKGFPSKAFFSDLRMFNPCFLIVEI